MNELNPHIPLYQSIYRDLMEKIINGEYAEGDQLPSEPELQKLYGVSRITVRRAMEMLQTDGYVHKGSGLGTIVQSTKHTLSLNKLTSFSQANIHHSTSSRLLRFQVLEADAEVRNQLKLFAGDTVSMHERLRMVEGEVLAFQRVYVPTRLIALKQEDLAAPDASLYQVFAKRHLVPTNADEVISAVLAGELAADLNVKKEDPLIYVARTTYDAMNQVLEYAQIYYRADKYQYKIHLDSV